MAVSFDLDGEQYPRLQGEKLRVESSAFSLPLGQVLCLFLTLGSVTGPTRSSVMVNVSVAASTVCGEKRSGVGGVPIWAGLHGEMCELAK